MTTRYEPPDHDHVLTKEDIRRRYQDTALVIFKEQQNKKEVVNYLSFGTSRRTMEYSNYGNQPVIIRRPHEASDVVNDTLPRRILRMYRKPRENCSIA
ncbi:putative uncharacterized protein BRD3OS [Polistes fuscatus]|uniref:putative uncharacterized protein BRD3OS n=1 Tax=Polistes fuscatus TaxID=30207 RepID=UPI001CA7E749|nr:putative uncharacterized protein BRD3OS [Polistes fuscatus]